MRMWLCNPKILCQKHLCGEHLEMHMFIGTLRKKLKVDGYLKNNLLQPRYLFQRHEELANEMKNRGYKHNSTITEIDCSCILNLSNEQQYWEINKELALKDLLDRCPECRNRYASVNRN